MKLNIVKKIINLIIYKIIDYITISNSALKQNEDSLIIIKLDAIGDYILFRNFLEEISLSNKFSNHKLTLLGNIVWKDLSVFLDSKFIDNFIWLDTNKFLNNYQYRYNFLVKNNNKKYSTLINAEYSRSFWISDWVSNFIFASNKIAHLGDSSNSKIWQKRITDLYYTNLVKGDKEVTFEFIRNKAFIENIIDEKSLINKTFINRELLLNNHALPSKYIIIFLGSSKKNSKWSPLYYAKVAEHLIDIYNFTIVICGGKNDVDQANLFKSVSKFEFIDLVGKTTIIELLSIISKASLLISNETSAPHFSVALNIKTIVLYNGYHFGRFVPYPNSLTNSKYNCICHPVIISDEAYYREISNSYGYFSKLNINNISIEKVIFEVDNMFATESI